MIGASNVRFLGAALAEPSAGCCGLLLTEMLRNILIPKTGGPARGAWLPVFDWAHYMAMDEMKELEPKAGWCGLIPTRVLPKFLTAKTGGPAREAWLPVLDWAYYMAMDEGKELVERYLSDARNRANGVKTEIDHITWEGQQARRRADAREVEQRRTTETLRRLFRAAQLAATGELKYRIDRLKEIHRADSEALSAENDH
jgi:hypothetical protein